MALAAGANAEEEARSTAEPRHDGYVLYQQLCAECHGARGDGNGPRASEFSPRPTDLTRLRGPEDRDVRVDDLARAIDGRRTLRAHGDGNMPVWGWELLADIPDPEVRERARLQMVYTLAEYVASLQKRAPETGAEGEPAAEE